MEKKVFLTFDDGPNPPCTDQMLEVLRSHGVPATFFMCGRNIERFPDHAKRVAAEGHTVGNHAYSHAWRMILSTKIGDEFLRTRDIISRITGTEGSLGRPPWGKIRPSVRKKLITQGFRFFNWDVEAFDWWRPPASFIAHWTLARIRPGSIVLLHDGGKTNIRVDRSRTVTALPRIIKTLQDRGYAFEKLA